MAFEPPPLSRKTAVTVIVILTFAALALRATSADLTPYNIDEAGLSILANKVANYPSRFSSIGQFPLVGIQTSLGFHNPPLMGYLLAPFFVLTPWPQLAMFALAMAGAGAAGMAGLTARRLWGGWAGVIAASLVAFCPMAIEHSRRLWGHDTILFWSAFSIYTAVRSIQTGRKRWMWTSVAACAAAQACHLSGVLLWIVPLGALWRFRPPHTRATLVAAAASLAIVYAPWILYDAKPHTGAGRFSELARILHILTGTTGEAGRPTAIPPGLVWLTMLTDGFHNDCFGPEYGEFLMGRRWFGLWTFAARGLATILALGGLAALLNLWRRGNDDPARTWAALLAAAALAPVALFTILPVEAVPPYQLPALIPVALGAAHLLARLGGAGAAPVGQEEAPRASSHTLAFAAVLAAVLFLGSFGTTMTARSRAYLTAATPANHVSSLLRFKVDALIHIIGAAGDEPYSIAQDGRREAAGVDYWVLYLHYAIRGDDGVPVNRSAPQLFVIVDSKTRLRPEPAAFLSGRPASTFGNLTVIRLAMEDALAWRELTDLYPSARPSNS